MTITIRDIEWVVCAKYGLSKELIRSPDKRKKVARPRQIIMFLARELTSASHKKIGRHFNRDHSTVVHSVQAIRKLMEANPRVLAHVVECRESMPQASPRKALDGYWVGRLLEGDVSWLEEPAAIRA